MSPRDRSPPHKENTGSHHASLPARPATDLPAANPHNSAQHHHSAQHHLPPPVRPPPGPRTPAHSRPLCASAPTAQARASPPPCGAAAQPSTQTCPQTRRTQTPTHPHCLPACLLACLRACVPACMPACLPACLPAACLPACQLACLPASQLACLPGRLPACQPATHYRLAYWTQPRGPTAKARPTSSKGQPRPIMHVRHEPRQGARQGPPTGNNLRPHQDRKPPKQRASKTARAPTIQRDHSVSP